MHSFQIRGGGLPKFLAHFQEVHFWSKKELISYKMPITWTLNCFFSIHMYTYITIYSLHSIFSPKLIFKSFFFYIYYFPWGARKSTFWRYHNLISVRHRKYRLIILLYLHLISCSSTLDLLGSRDWLQRAWSYFLREEVVRQSSEWNLSPH